jgi:hypothetical protein
MPVDCTRQDVSDAPQRGVPTVPAADGGISRPSGPVAPAPHQPGAQNPAATDRLPGASPAPVDRQEMPQAPGPHVSEVR